MDPDPLPACSAPDCAADASFYVYADDAGAWQPVCPPHARRYHPSLEVHVWLESGYMTPAELGRPDGPPEPPPGDRARTFRATVEEAMGWTE